MEGPGKPYRKNAAELERQHALSNKVEVDGRPANKTEVPYYLAQLDPQEIQGEIDLIRQKSPEERSSYDQEVLEKFEVYVANLRVLRSEQRPQIHGALEQLEDDSLRRETFLKSISWSGPIQEKILLEMEEQGGFAINPRVMSDSEIKQVSNTREGFVDTLVSFARLRPLEIILKLPELKKILEPREVTELLDVCVAEKPELIGRHAVQLSLVYGNEFPLRFVEAAKQSGHRSFVQAIMGSAELRAQLGKDQVSAIIRSCMSSDLDAIKDIITNQPEEFSVVESAVINEVLTAKLSSYDKVKKLDFIREIWGSLDDTGREICIGEAEVLFNNDDLKVLSLGDYKGILNLELLREKSRRILLEDNTRRTITSLNEIQLGLTPEESVEWVRAYIRGERKNFSLSFNCNDQLIGADWLTPEEKHLLAQKVIRENPVHALGDADLYLESFNPEERTRILLELADEVSPNFAIQNASKWVPYSGESRDVQKSALLKRCLEDEDVAFLDWYENPTTPSQEIFCDLIDRTELLHILESKAEIDPRSVLRHPYKLQKLLGSEAAVKQFVERIHGVSPQSFVSSLDRVAYLYTPEELEERIIAHLNSLKSSREVFSHIQTWAPRLGVERTIKLCHEYIDIMCLNPDAVETYVKLDEKRSIEAVYMTLLDVNPAAALYFLHNSGIDNIYKRSGITMTPEEIRSAALQGADQTPIHKTLTKFWTAADPTSINNTEGSELAEWKHVAQLYLQCADIERSGLSDTMVRIVEAEQVDAEGEQRLLALMRTYAELKRAGVAPEDEESEPTSTEELEQALYRGMEQILDSDGSSPSEEWGQFVATMGSPGPFVSYLTQYQHSKAHKELLAHMYKALGKDEYSTWKYGTDETMQSFQDQGWLPRSLTAEQYSAWATDEVSSLHETLVATAEEVVSAIKKILLDNVIHLRVHDFESTVADPDRALSEIREQLVILGRKLAEIGKQTSLLNRSADVSDSDKESVRAEKKKIEYLRSELIRNRDLVRLSSLTPDELLSGYLMEDGRKVQSLNNLLIGIGEKLPFEGRFVIDNILSQINMFRMAGANTEDVTCEDTSDPKVTLEIGALPVESCQHYNNGSYNECLLGYTEPNTKVLVVRNERGNIVARSVFRLLATAEGEPVLHVEQIYTTTASSGVRRAVFEHASRKATELGLPLTADLQEVQSAVNMKTDTTTLDLVSRGARAPKVYVDSAGGARSRGRYQIVGAHVVTRAA